MSRIIVVHEDDLRELIESVTRRVIVEALEGMLIPLLDKLDAAKRDERRVYSAAEVGEMLGCSARQVLEFHVRRGLKAYRPGRVSRFLISDVEDYLRRHPMSRM